MIECWVCHSMIYDIVAIRGGKQVCKECAAKIDAKKPIDGDGKRDFTLGYHNGNYIFIKPLPISKFEDMLNDDTFAEYFVDTLIVRIKYKYDHEDKWTIENEIMELCLGYSGDGWTWLNDWNEGQQQCFVLGWCNLSDIEFE